MHTNLVLVQVKDNNDNPLFSFPLPPSPPTPNTRTHAHAHTHTCTLTDTLALPLNIGGLPAFTTMDSYPDPGMVGKAFVKQYYTQMHKDPSQMHR